MYKMKKTKMKKKKNGYYYMLKSIDCIAGIETKGFEVKINLNHLETTEDKVKRINDIQKYLTEILIDSILTDDQDKNNSDD